MSSNSSHQQNYANEPKTANAEVEYQNLFRGMSTYNVEHIGLETKHSIIPDNNMYPISYDANGNHSNQTHSNHDLSDLLLREQLLQGTTMVPQVSNEVVIQEGGLTELSTLDYVKSELNVDNFYQYQNIQIPIDQLQPKYEDTITEPSETIKVVKLTPARAGARNRVVFKRLNSKTQKIVSSSSGKVILSKKPSIGKVSLSKMKLSKKQKAQLEAASDAYELARFGNKFVEKYTDEYEIRRQNNNEAVKKCREKLTQTQATREARMTDLTTENRRLLGTVDTLTKELTVLKGILSRMKNKLPEHLEKLLRDLDEP